MVDSLNWLANTDASKLGDAPHRHETWPINYAPDTGEGASKWKPARELYEKLECGKEGVIPRIAGKVDYENRWTKVAKIGVQAALIAKRHAPRGVRGGHPRIWFDGQVKRLKITGVHEYGAGPHEITLRLLSLR